MSVRAPQRTLRGSFCLCFAGVDPRVRSAPRRGCSNQGLCSATSSRALRARRLGEVALAKAFVMRAFILAFARPPAAPRRRSFAVPRASRRGQTFACFLVWVRGSRTTVVLVCELECASGRRLAPYPSAASDGGQKMRRSSAKELPNSQVNPATSQRQTHFRGAERQRGWTLAKRKPSPTQTSSLLPCPATTSNHTLYALQRLT